MTTRLKKLALATAVTAGLAGASLPAHSMVLGAAGEALLVPLVVWSGGTYWVDGGTLTDQGIPRGYTPAVDTIIEVLVPGSIGFDAVPNIFTAMHTTPTNTPTSLKPSDPDLALYPGGSPPNDTGISVIHWYWFDKRSIERASDDIPVTADQVVQISWTQAAYGRFENEPGYMIIANESARTGNAAQFSMFGNAWLTGAFHFDPVERSTDNNPDAASQIDFGIGFPMVGASIPVLPMSDGADSSSEHPNAQDSVKYWGGSPAEASPVIAGMRTNRSDGQPDGFAFDLSLSDRRVPTIHVIWFDQNLNNQSEDGEPTISELYPTNTARISDRANTDTFDDQENSCNGTVTLPNELNVVWIPAAYETDPSDLDFINEPFLWATQTQLYCVVADPTNTRGLPYAAENRGFVQYRMREYLDTAVGFAESSMVAFSIKVDGALVSNDVGATPDAAVILLESALGHDLGTFKTF